MKFRHINLGIMALKCYYCSFFVCHRLSLSPLLFRNKPFKRKTVFLHFSSFNLILGSALDAWRIRIRIYLTRLWPWSPTGPAAVPLPTPISLSLSTTVTSLIGFSGSRSCLTPSTPDPILMAAPPLPTGRATASAAARI